MSLFGLRFSIGNGIVLGITFLFGFYFGKLTKNINLFKIILLLFIGAYLYQHLKNTHFVIVWFFIFGILANHGQLIYRAFSWAYDLKDLFFALRYRRAFEDIRRKEEELEERERRFREEQANFYRQQQESQKQRQWREEARREQERQQKQSEQKQKSGSEQRKQKQQSSGRTKQEKRSGQDSLKVRYLKILGLDAGREYSKDELKKAFRKRAQKVHPDKGGSHEAFLELMKAYEWLRS